MATVVPAKASSDRTERPETKTRLGGKGYGHYPRSARDRAGIQIPLSHRAGEMPRRRRPGPAATGPRKTFLYRKGGYTSSEPSIRAGSASPAARAASRK